MGSIEHFANQHKLRVKRDEVGGKVIPGRLGHLYEHDDRVLALMLISPSGDNPKLNNTLRARTRKALRGGLELHQRGDYESTFLFNRENTQHAGLAIRLIGARKCRATGRPFTPALAQVIGKATQFQPTRRVEGPETTQSGGIDPQAEEVVEVSV